jgi:ribosomal protein L37E
VIRCADVNPEFLLDAEECHRRGIQSLIAVPVYHDGQIAGALELYYDRIQAFTEQDVHTCQLMAGLVTEALARDEELSWKQSLSTERAAMLEALEKLKPSLAALVDAPQTKAPVAASSTAVFNCRKCGHHLVGEEQFCGKCGQPRSSDYEPPSMQSKVASLWHMQEARKKNMPESPANGDLSHEDSPMARAERSVAGSPLADSIAEEMPELFVDPDLEGEKAIELEGFPKRPTGNLQIEDPARPEITIPSQSSEDEEEDSPDRALVMPERATAWSSAVTAREFLERLAPNRRGGLTGFLQARKGDVYLSVAVVLVAFVLVWGIWSNHSVGATGNPAIAAGHRKPAPEADLSWFDRMLVGLGLAEAPAPPESKGNPDTQVWVDLKTALYYCPGADLYGKTPKGKFAAQRDAQLDQFEPAYRKPCE